MSHFLLACGVPDKSAGIGGLKSWCVAECLCGEWKVLCRGWYRTVWLPNLHLGGRSNLVALQGMRQ